jgi:uncharacterized cofD-like protein
MKQPQGIKAVVIGGGTGTFMVLSALKHYIPNLSAIINMVDDGGSTGVLRDELGVLPPGDIRQALVALSSSSETVRELFNYRFGEGTFEGHAFGNLLLTALEKITGSFAEAVKTAGQVLDINGQVIPVTTDDVRLCYKDRQGNVVVGEKTVTQSFFAKGEHPEIFLRPHATLNPEAAKAIKQADLIIIGPGNVYSSLIPTLLVDGMGDALRSAKGKKIYVCNLVTKPGQTDGFKVHDFAASLERYAGGPIFDYVVYNTAKPAQELLDNYAKEGELWVEIDKGAFTKAHYQAVGENLISKKIHVQNPNDKFLQRTLIRHDNDKLARIFMRLYTQK